MVGLDRGVLRTVPAAQSLPLPPTAAAAPTGIPSSQPGFRCLVPDQSESQRLGKRLASGTERVSPGMMSSTASKDLVTAW